MSLAERIAPQLRALVSREVRAVRVASLAGLALSTLVVLAALATTAPADRYAALRHGSLSIGMHGAAGVLGLALGWLSVEDERRTGTWQGYLLLPVDRRLLVGVKFAVSALAIALAVGVPSFVLVCGLFLPRATGGPIDPRFFAMPLTVSLTGFIALGAAWVASLSVESRLFGLRFLPILSAALVGLALTALAHANLAVLFGLAGLALLAFVWLAWLRARALRGASPPSAKWLVALVLTPLMLMVLLVGYDVAHSRLSRYFASASPAVEPFFVEFDPHGELLTGNVAALARRQDRAIVLSPLDRRTFEGDSPTFTTLERRAFYDVKARTFAFYDSKTGEPQGCLGASGLERPCKPLPGELLDVLSLSPGAALIVTTEVVWSYSDDMAAPLEVLSGDLHGAHVLLRQDAAFAVEVGDEVLAVDSRFDVVARCRVPAGLKRNASDRLNVGVTRERRVVALLQSDATARAFSCGTGELTEIAAFDRAMPPPMTPRSLEQVVGGPLGWLLQSAFGSGANPASMPLLASAVSSSALAWLLTLFAGSRGRRRMDGLRSAWPWVGAMSGLLIGPAYVVALLLVSLEGIRAQKRRPEVSCEVTVM
ncbi:MAG: hypothetical protein U0271_09870 [Polyangiaceae bacterium]